MDAETWRWETGIGRWPLLSKRKPEVDSGFIFVRPIWQWMGHVDVILSIYCRDYPISDRMAENPYLSLIYFNSLNNKLLCAYKLSGMVLAHTVIKKRKNKNQERRSTMTLVKYNPYRGFANLSETVDRFFNGFASNEDEALSVWTPLVDISEAEDHYEVVAEIPGLDKNDVTVSFEDHVLTLKGEKKANHEDKKLNYHRVERFFGKFERSLRLPQSVKTDEIKAKYENGILTVTIPKSEEAKPREISIG
jgi:HSP20 family protein